MNCWIDSTAKQWKIRKVHSPHIPIAFRMQLWMRYEYVSWIVLSTRCHSRMGCHWNSLIALCTNSNQTTISVCWVVSFFLHFLLGIYKHIDDITIKLYSNCTIILLFFLFLSLCESVYLTLSCDWHGIVCVCLNVPLDLEMWRVHTVALLRVRR